MKHAVLGIALIGAVAAQAQSLDYDWLTQPCGTMLNCDSGCSACALPASGGPLLLGSAIVWHGIDACPHAVTVGDNAVLTYGWSATPDTGHFALLSGVALAPVHIDSIIIRHRRSSGGPERLSVRFGINVNLPTDVVSDVAVDESMSATVITELGCVQPEAGMALGFFQLLLQAYNGNSGAWEVDEVRIVASPCSTTGWPLIAVRPDALPSTMTFDLLGRNAGPSARVFGASSGGRIVLVP